MLTRFPSNSLRFALASSNSSWSSWNWPNLCWSHSQSFSFINDSPLWTLCVGFTKLCCIVHAWCVEPLGHCTRRVCNGESGARTRDRDSVWCNKKEYIWLHWEYKLLPKLQCSIAKMKCFYVKLQLWTHGPWLQFWKTRHITNKITRFFLINILI